MPGKKKHDTGTFSIVILEDVNGNGSLNWGDTITFNVQSTATYPMVEVTATQNGVVVYSHGAGFYGGYPFGTDFKLAGWKWPSGAADCVAELYAANPDGSKRQTLYTKDFHVDG